MNLLFTGNYQLNSSKINELEQLGIKVYIMKEEDAPLIINPEEIDAVVGNWFFVNHDIRQFTNLKYVQLLSAGMDRIPIEYICEHNIKVNNARDVYSVPMAEFVVCGVLQMLKNSQKFMEQQSQHIWEKQRDLEELSDKSICILGMGSVGREVAKKFSVFTEEIFGIDMVDIECQYIKRCYNIDMLENVVAESDIVVVTLPLTEQTTNLFDDRLLNKMKNTVILVNVARGKIVNENDLINAIESGKIKGAVLDVFEKEPLVEESRIWDCPNVIVTPHNSFVSNLNNDRMWEIIVNNLKKYIMEKTNE